MEKYYYKYEEFREDVKTLISKCKGFDCEVILGISRGGLTLAHLMGEGMGIRKVYSMNSIHYKSRGKLDSIEVFNIPDLNDFSKILIVDDIVDSGVTMQEIFKILREKYPKCEFKLATLFYKEDALVSADFTVKEAKSWIDFFWEVDLEK